LSGALRLAGLGYAQPPAAEWLSLFDGKSLEGWQETPFTDRGPVRVENGTIILGAGEMTGITRTGEFPKSNFEVRFEAARLQGRDYLAGLTFPVGASLCTLIRGDQPLLGRTPDRSPVWRDQIVRAFWVRLVQDHCGVA